MLDKPANKNLTFSDAFKEMLNELSWKTLEKYVKDHGTLHEEVTKGGYRLISTSRRHVEEMLANEASPHSYEAPYVQSVFFAWYNEQPHHEMLDTYFQSDDYKEMSRKKKLSDGEYIIEDKLLNQLLEEMSAPHAMYLLYFSPIRFTVDQENNILGRISAVQPALKEEDAGGRLEISHSDEGIQSQLLDLKREKKAIEKLNRELEVKLKNYKNMTVGLQNTNHELRGRLDIESTEAKERLSAISEELESKREEHQQVKRLLRALEKEKKRKSRRIEELTNRNTELDIENRHLKNVPLLNEIIPRGVLNPMLVSALNAPDEVKDLLLSYLREPTTDIEINSSALGSELTDMWSTFVAREQRTINELTKISIPDILTGDAMQDWGERSDQLKDLEFSLRARVILISLIYEILYNHYVSDSSKSSDM